MMVMMLCCGYEYVLEVLFYVSFVSVWRCMIGLHIEKRQRLSLTFLILRVALSKR